MQNFHGWTHRGAAGAVIPLGMMTRSVLVRRSSALVSAVLWHMNASRTSMLHRPERPPSSLLLQTVHTQPWTSPSSSHPFCCVRTMTLVGNLSLGSVFLFNTTYGGSLPQSAVQVSMSVNQSFSWPVVLIVTLRSPFSVMVVRLSQYSSENQIKIICVTPWLLWIILLLMWDQVFLLLLFCCD